LIKLRIWSLTSDYHLLTLKLMIKSLNDYENTLQKTKEIIFKKYAIEDVTIEIEIEKNI
jgi:Co/Zn/Cd efflux system component